MSSLKKMNEILLLWKFLLNPSPEQVSSNTAAKLTRLLIVFCVNIIAAAFFLGIQYYLNHFGIIQTNLFPKPDAANPVIVISIIISIVLLIPVIEEVIFRLHLLPKKRNLILSIITLIVYLTAELALSSKTHLTITIFTSSGLLLLTAYLVFSNKLNKAIKNTWNRRFPVVFYITTIVFGGIHIFNHNLSISNLILSPIIIAPQIVLGLNVGYLRVVSGFKWGLWLHVLHNIVFYPLVLFLIYPELLSFNIHTTEFKIDYPGISWPPVEYTLKIDEEGEGVINSYKISADEIFFENTPLEEVFTKLANTNMATVIFENNEIRDKKLNITFKTLPQKNRNKRQNHHFILQEIFKKYNLKADLHIVPQGTWVLMERNVSNPIGPKASIPPQTEEQQEWITLKDVTTKELEEKIEILYDIKCVSVPDNKEYHNIIIPKSDIAILQETLLLKYGLELFKSETKSDFFYVSFVD